MSTTYFTVDGHGRFARGVLVEAAPLDLSGAPEDLATGAREWIGDVGEHGRIALLSDEPAWRADASLEMVLELTRREVMPAAPSRFSALFACCSVTDAEQFRDRHRTPEAAIYEVAGPSDAFRGDARLLGLTASALAGAVYARWYWQGRPNPLTDPLWEVLLPLPVTIGERVG